MIAADATSALGAPSETAAGADCPVSRASAPSQHPCPECGAHFALAHPRQIFCSKPHKRAFENRLISRGVSLTPAYMAARITRGGSQGRHKVAGIRARQIAEQLVANWTADDREAGRMTMDAYYALRLRLGYDG